MSPLAMLRPVAMFALVCVAGDGLHAQEIAVLEARVRRIDSLVTARWTEVGRSRRDSTSDLRTLTVGGFQLQASPPIAAIAAEGARRAWARIGARGGSWLERELPRHVILVSRNMPSGGRRAVDQVAVEVLETSGSNGMRVDTRQDAAGIEDALTNIADQLLLRALGGSWPWLTRASTWVERRMVVVSHDDRRGMPPVLALRIDAGSPTLGALAYRLRLVPSRANRGCLAGDASACLVSLGIGTDGRRSASTWYAPSDYPWMVAGASLDLSGPTMLLVTACLRERRDAACGTLVEGARFGAPWPTDPGTRATFLALALDLGGSGALDRLLATPGPVEARLEAAAGRPLIDVARAWQARVREVPSTATVRRAASWLLAMAFVILLLLVGSRRVSS